MSWLAMGTAAVYVTIITATGLLAASSLRAAVYRHCVLLATLGSILAGPLLLVSAAWTGIVWTLPVVAFTPGPQAEDRKALAPEASAPRFPSREISGPVASMEVADNLRAGSESLGQPQVVAPASAHVSWHLNRLATAVWASGTTVLLFGVARSVLRGRAILGSAQPLQQVRYAGVVQDVVRTLGVSGGFRVGTTAKVPGPATIGLMRPWIVLPSSCLSALTPRELFQVLLHEGAHAVRRDPLIALLQHIGGALFWWHPLVHVVNRRLVDAREDICDNAVIGVVEPADYCATLLRLATFPHATCFLRPTTGILGSRPELEVRIRGLLNPARNARIRVDWGTLLATFSAFALMSFGAAFAQFAAKERVDVGHPANRAPEEPITFSWMTPVRPNPALENVDLQRFRLDLSFRGKQDKPFYGLTLSVPAAPEATSDFQVNARIDEAQAGKIIEFLKRFELLLAPDRGQPADSVADQYVLRVWTGDKSLQESLGWDLGTFIRLRGLRQVLEGPAAQAMDRLLSRLKGDQESWEKGVVVRDLAATLRLEDADGYVYSGDPIPIRLTLTNNGNEPRSFGARDFVRTRGAFSVFDEHGRQLAFLGGEPTGDPKDDSVSGGESVVLSEFDLSSVFYLRSPGRYAVTFHTDGMPTSNAVHFDVIPPRNGDGDGDPISKLLPTLPEAWHLVGSPNALPNMQPGKNRSRTPGWQFMLVDQARESQVWLWLTKETIDELPGTATDTYPASVSLGKVARWHAYFYASPKALDRWPSVRSDLVNALEGRLITPHVASVDPTDEDVRLLHDRYKKLILPAARAGDEREVARLTDAVNAIAGQRLLFVQVVSRSKDRNEPRVLLSRYHGPRQIPIGKLNFETADRPYVLRDRSEQYVLVATNKGQDNQWPDELQITMVVDDAAPVTSATNELSRLLSAVPAGWWLDESPRSTDRVQPGGNWTEVPGRIVWFVRTPPLSQSDGLIMLWLTDTPAEPRQDRLSSMPASQYLGKVGPWHVYFMASEPALRTWPNAKADILTALSNP